MADCQFTSELRSMMYTMGDCRRPLDQSATVIERIVLKQLSHVINDARSLVGDNEEIDAKHLIVQLRKNTSLLRRLIAHFRAKDASGSYKALASDTPDDDSAESIIESTETPRIKLIRDALGEIDGTGELRALIDQDDNIYAEQTKRKRLDRMNSFVSGLEQAEYLRFCEARQVNFCGTKTTKAAGVKKFRFWLTGSDSPSAGANLTNTAIEVLSFLAKECVETLMDCALSVKAECGMGTRAPPEGSRSVSSMLAEKLRQRHAGNGHIGIDVVQKQAIQPWHIQEAYRRLNLACNGHIYLTAP